MAGKKGAKPLSFAEFKSEVVDRLDNVVSKADVDRVLKAVIEEATDCLTNGYKVNLPGLVSLTPSYVAEKPKGEMVRNPFDGTEKKRDKAVPASFKVKASASSGLKAKFPSVKTKSGQALEAQLATKKTKKKK